MFAQHSRSALLAGLLTVATLVPAWSADGDAAKPEAAGTPQPMAMAGSPPQTGPVLARESLATETSARATVVVGENQPTRSTGSPMVGKRYAGTRSSSGGYDRPSHRYSLMLGIGY
jgi:hypothetical protein